MSGPTLSRDQLIVNLAAGLLLKSGVLFVGNAKVMYAPVSQRRRFGLVEGNLGVEARQVLGKGLLLAARTGKAGEAGVNAGRSVQDAIPLVSEKSGSGALICATSPKRSIRPAAGTGNG